MPSILDTTVSGPDANSYADTTFATAYLTKKRNTSNWPAGTTDQEKLLFEAMASIESQEFWGVIAEEDQALQFPREGDSDSSGFYDARGRFWASDAIPTPIKEAQVEIALAIADGRYSVTASAARVAEYETDRLRVKLAGSGGSTADLPGIVEALLAPFLVKVDAVGSFSMTNVATW